MKIVPSPLVAQLTGRAAGAVCAMWRGVNYSRGYNPSPANPNTSGQQLARAALSHLTNIWKHAPALLRAAWDRFAEGLPKSGFNCFMQQNAADQQSDTWLKLTPSDPAEMPIEGLTISAGITTVKAEWVAMDAEPTDSCQVYAFKDVHPASRQGVEESAAVLAYLESNGCSVGALAKVLSGLASGTDYLIGILPRNGTTGRVPISALAKVTTTTA